jgi:hypothetical protein
MNVKAPKAPPTMGPIGSFESDFPCNTIVTTPGAADVVVNGEGVANDDEGGSCVENDPVANNVGGADVLDVVLVEELRNKVVKVDVEVIKIQVVQKK